MTAMKWEVQDLLKPCINQHGRVTLELLTRSATPGSFKFPLGCWDENLITSELRQWIISALLGHEQNPHVFIKHLFLSSPVFTLNEFGQKVPDHLQAGAAVRMELLFLHRCCSEEKKVTKRKGPKTSWGHFDCESSNHHCLLGWSGAHGMSDTHTGSEMRPNSITHVCLLS